MQKFEIFRELKVFGTHQIKRKVIF